MNDEAGKSCPLPSETIVNNLRGQGKGLGWTLGEERL